LIGGTAPSTSSPTSSTTPSYFASSTSLTPTTKSVMFHTSQLMEFTCDERASVKESELMTMSKASNQLLDIKLNSQFQFQNLTDTFWKNYKEPFHPEIYKLFFHKTSLTASETRKLDLDVARLNALVVSELAHPLPISSLSLNTLNSKTNDEEDESTKVGNVYLLNDIPFQNWSAKLFDEYFTGINRVFAHEPLLVDIVRFRRYGKGKKFEFECKFQSVTNRVNRFLNVRKYTELILNPAYKKLFSNYMWDIEEEKDLYETDIELLDSNEMSDFESDSDSDEKNKSGDVNKKKKEDKPQVKWRLMRKTKINLSL